MLKSSSQKSIKTVKNMAKSLSTMTTMNHQKKKKPPSQPPILKVDSSTKENTKNALPMKPIPYAITITSS